ncbi:MAG TPA: S-methyl-5'-thioadenosine phosphorylase [Desulfobacteraceae bacterium]|nr:S-methyl-5'-thioadenosine phosphorylase [Desulfobacteraceae bacterium]
MIKPKIAIIGGTGLDEIQGITEKQIIKCNTPFGAPSSEIIVGRIDHTEIAFLSRHGTGHAILPSEINFRANIYALKAMGIESILSVSAVGSLREDMRPMDIVLPDQFFDGTKNRISTFFGKGIVAHVNFSDPVCRDLKKIVYESALAAGVKPFNKGTYICIEGPQFSSRCESNLYRKLGFDVIGMTNLPEAKLAREAEICYCTIALVTDYDCWHENHGEVDIEMVFTYLNKNIDTAKKIIKKTLGRIPEVRKCACKNALEKAIITDKKLIPDDVKKNLNPIIGKYLGLEII